MYIKKSKVYILLMSLGLFSCASDNAPVFSILAEPGFDGYYIQTTDNIFLPLAKIKRSSFQENITVQDKSYPFCETYPRDEFNRITQLEQGDYQVVAVRGDLGRSVANDYKLYRMHQTISGNNKTIQLCAEKITSQLAKHGATFKIKALTPLSKGLYYIKDKTWFINDKSRLFILK